MGYSAKRHIPLVGWCCNGPTHWNKICKPIPLLAQNFDQNAYSYRHKFCKKWYAVNQLDFAAVKFCGLPISIYFAHFNFAFSMFIQLGLMLLLIDQHEIEGHYAKYFFSVLFVMYSSIWTRCIFA